MSLVAATLLWNDRGVENHVSRSVYGPFHRLLAPGVQDAHTTVRQVLSGELWGRPPAWGGEPAVKAYAGSLPDGASGVEFWAFQAPDAPYGPQGAIGGRPAIT